MNLDCVMHFNKVKLYCESFPFKYFPSFFFMNCMKITTKNSVGVEIGS